MTGLKKSAWKLALLNLPKTLKVLLFISIIIVVLYHIQQFCEQTKYYFFNVNSTSYVVIKILSEFISKLSYAVITSTIFYFITQQLPKENKRIRVAQFLNNMFPFIQSPFRDYKFDLFEQELDIKTVQDYNKHCDTISLDAPVRPQLANCISWEKFTLQTLEKMTKKNDEMNQLSDLLDTNTFILLQQIKSNCLTISNLLALRNRSMQESDKVSYISSLLFAIRSDLIALGKSAEKFIALYTGMQSFKSIF
jgi:hypothetical protein